MSNYYLWLCKHGTLSLSPHREMHFYYHRYIYQDDSTILKFILCTVSISDHLNIKEM